MAITKLTSKYDALGGYDCMTAAYHLSDQDGIIRLSVDLSSFGQERCQPPTAEQAQAAAIFVANLVDAYNRRGFY